MAATKTLLLSIPITLLVAGCQSTNIQDAVSKPLDFLTTQSTKLKTGTTGAEAAKENSGSENVKTLASILGESGASVNMSKGFSKSIASAVISDPTIIAAADEVDARSAALASLAAKKDFQVGGTLYGGVEDVTDETNGLAAVLTANRLIYDGGKLDAQIQAEQKRLAAAKHSLDAKLNERALQLASIWIDLDKYEKLNAEIESRLLILDPLIQQLEKVAKAGVGDVSQVAAAQRTVSAIRVTQTDVNERLEQSRVSFINSFGSLPARGSFEGEVLAGKVPSQISKTQAQSAPALLSQYSTYLASEADLVAVKARDEFELGFESRVSKPFGGSEFDSKESIGLVLRKNFYDGGGLEAEIEQAEAKVQVALAQVKAVHREGERIIKNAQQSIKSMNAAIDLARANAEVTSDEIKYLRKQLVIGGSTLDSVLSAEARLYDAESKEINYLAERSKSQVTILSALGLLSGVIGISGAGSI